MNAEYTSISEEKLKYRPKGHYIRIDILLSLLRVGIRRGDMKVAQFASILLCRGDMWKECLGILTSSLLLDTNYFTEPLLRETTFKLIHRLNYHLKRKGVQHNTVLNKKLLAEIVYNLVHCTKSRLVFHCMVCIYENILKRHKEISDQFSAPMTRMDCLQYIFKKFRNSYSSSGSSGGSADDCLVWATLLDIYAESDDLYGTLKIWRHMIKNSKHPQLVKELCDNCVEHPSYRGNKYYQKIALTEAILLNYLPIKKKNGEGVKVFSGQQSLDPLWDMPLTLEIRKLIDWDQLLPVVAGMYTAIGKNVDTIHEFRECIGNQNITPDLIPPESNGFQRTSLIHYELTVSCQINNRLLADQYENGAKQFLSSIERGQFLPAFFPKSYQSATLTFIRKIAFKILKFPAPDNIIIPESKQDKDVREKPVKRTMSAGNIRDARNVPVILPGIVVSHQEVLAGPTDIDGQTVKYCQLLHVPVAGQQPHWAFGMADAGNYYLGLRFPEMASTVPVYLDKIKVKFGLRESGVRFVNEEWLVWRDYGKGGPYSTTRDNFKKYAIVDAKATGFINVVDITEGFNMSEGHIAEICKMALFRAIFRVQNTLLGNFVFSSVKNCIYSIGEYVTTRTLISIPEVEQEADDVNLKILGILFNRGSDYTPVPFVSHPVMEKISEYINSPQCKSELLSCLLKWELQLFDLPPLPRPVLNFPTPDNVKKNIDIIIGLFKG